MKQQHQQQLQAAVNNIISAHKTLQDLLDTGVRQMNEIQAMLGEQVDATAPVKTRTRKAAAPVDDKKKTARKERRQARRAEKKAAAAKAERAAARKAKQQ